MAFVIRSMSTTDYVPGNRHYPEQNPVPYHIYLKPAGQRAGAYWAGLYNAARFETEEEAQAEAVRARITSYEVAPADADARGLPTFWDNRR